MEYLKSSWKTVVGNNQEVSTTFVTETIEKLIERVENSTLLEDRRDATRALKSFSKTYRLEVGAKGIDVLINVLRLDRNDVEIASFTLDALNNIISGAQEDPLDYDGTSSPNEATEDLGIQFTEIFAKKKENIALLLELLEEYDFKVRWPALKLLMGLLRNKLRDIQEAILANPMGVSRLMDLLDDSREIIRNDAILLLVHLTRGNANIQKIVAFENAFDRLFQIICSEGYSEGGVVVEDCSIVLQNLIKNNTSNQNFFKEGSYIQRLLPFVDIDVSNEWTAQKATNVLFFLQVIRSLVSPSNPLQIIASCQKLMHSSRVLEKLCNIFLTNGIPVDILTETINTVAEIIRGNHHNQEYFSALTTPAGLSRPVIVILLMSMVNEKQPLELRCAVLYCFQCFLYKNEFGQAQIIQTLLPNAAEVSSVTAGQLLCGGLFSSDSLSNWFVTTALSHTLIENKLQKEQLLRVQLASEEKGIPISLLNQCCSLLQQCTKYQIKFGLLMLLSTWLSNCPLAVNHFLQITTNVPYLTSQVGLAEGDDLELLTQGLCAFLLGICILDNDDSVLSFTREDLNQLIIKRVGIDIFLDKINSISKNDKFSLAAQKPQIKNRRPDDIIFDYEFCRLFRSLEGNVTKVIQNKPIDFTTGPEANMNAEQHKLLIQYKELIREQDSQIKQIKEELLILSEKHNKILAERNELYSNCQQLKDQNALLKASKSNLNSSPFIDNESSVIHNELKKQNEELCAKIEILEKQLSKNNVNSNLSSLETKINITDDNEDELTILKNDKLFLTKKVEALESQVSKAFSDLDNTKKEQDDLLILLTDQDLKIREYKKKLSELGYQVEDEYEDDIETGLAENFE